MHALILIPGLFCDRRLWSEQMQVLADFAEISVADITQQENISEMAGAVLEEAPAEFSLAGFSLGSQVALEIMRVAKHRVKRLALLSATGGGLQAQTAAALQKSIEMLQGKGLEEYIGDAYPAYVAAGRAGDPVLKSTFVNMARAVGKEAGLRQMRALLAIQGAITPLGEIRCQTVVIGGREDRRTTPAAHEELAKQIPGAELVIVEDAGHFTPLEKPGSVSEALSRWLME
jgi:pimeloyl-ACP methyl ester carboxylesterase